LEKKKKSTRCRHWNSPPVDVQDTDLAFSAVGQKKILDPSVVGIEDFSF